MLKRANLSTRKPAIRPGVQALLFDLGGVVMEIDFERAFQQWRSISRLSLEEIRQSFSFDAPYQAHERGEIAVSAYFSHLRAVLQLQGSDAEIAAGWNSIFIREIRETMELVRLARATLACHVFTNTNATHQAAWCGRFPAFAQSFDRIFSSHEIGLRKPERRAFEHVAAAVGLAPRSILFFDDLAENVEGARSAGLQAVHVRGPGDVRNGLREAGMISP